MNDVKISIIIPTYKPKDYLFDCINAIRNQEIDISKQLEVIIVLNGEKEPYYSNIKNYLRYYDKNFKLVYIEEKGVSFARNFGLSIAQGCHVLFLDDDDFISTNFLDYMLKNVSDEKTIIISNFLKYFQEKKHVRDDYMTKRFKELKDYKRSDFSLLTYSKFMSSCCGKLIPMSVISNCKFDTSIKISEDALFMFKISCNIQNIQLSSNDIIYYRRVRSESAMRQKKGSVELLNNLCNVSFRLLKIYLSNPTKYSILFLINRLLALFKFFTLNLIK